MKHTNTMKYILGLIICTFLFACGPSKPVWPEDLAGKQKLLIAKKGALKSITEDIEKLEEELEELMPAREEKKFAVNVMPLEKETFTSYAKIQGTIMTDNVVMASSETGGRIVSMSINEGDYVNAGQLIATMDVGTLEKQLDELTTRLDLAKTVFERQERLWNQKIGSELQFLEAKANVESIEKSMVTLKSQLVKKDVFAAISGYADRIFLKQGELASPGMPIIQILNTGQVKIVADVPESYLASIKRGDYVDVSFPALDKEMKKKVTLVGRSIDPANRTFKIEMATSNPGGLLKPNLLAELNIVEKKMDDQVVIPLEVIQQEVTGKRFVYVVDSSDANLPRAKKVYVDTGDSYDNEIVVTQGLQGTESLVVAGGQDLQAEAALIIEETVVENE